jgi:hypothetical protein
VSGGLVFKERYWPSFRRALTTEITELSTREGKLYC